MNRTTQEHDASPEGGPVETVTVAERPVPPLAPEGSVRPKDWVRTVIIRDEIDRYLGKDGKDFIDDDRIGAILAERKEPSRSELRDILAKSKAIKSLDLEEAGALMRVRDPEAWREMIDAASAWTRYAGRPNP